MPQPIPAPNALHAGRWAFPGFAVVGFLAAAPGALLTAWDHHLRAEYLTPASYFFAWTAGFLTARMFRLDRLDVPRGASIAFAASFAALFALSFATILTHLGLRLALFAVAGLAAGLAGAELLRAIAPLVRQDPGPAANIATGAFCAGAFLCILLSALAPSNPGGILRLASAFPALIVIRLRRSEFRGESPRHVSFSLLRRRSGALFAAIVFLQAGVEISVASWLPLFLNQSFGLSPANGLLATSVYWCALLAGRIAWQWLLARVSSIATLALYATGAGCGLGMLALTNNAFGATLGAGVVGFMLSASFPLALHTAGLRLPDYAGGAYARIGGFILTGAMLLTGITGLLAELESVRSLILAPLTGLALTAVLHGALIFESRFGSRRTAA